jgi:hypothetical protein
MLFHCDYCDREFNEYIMVMKHESNCKVVNLEKIILPYHKKRMLSSDKTIKILINYLNQSQNRNRKDLEYDFFQISSQYKNDIEYIKEQLIELIPLRYINVINESNDLIYFKIKYL